MRTIGAGVDFHLYTSAPLRRWTFNREQFQDAVKVFVSPPAPDYAVLLPPFSQRHKCADFYVQIIAYYAVFPTGIPNSKIIDPSGRNYINLRHDLGNGAFTTVQDYVAYFSPDRLAVLLFRRQRMKCHYFLIEPIQCCLLTILTADFVLEPPGETSTSCLCFL